ncbi:long-chain-fatty-acid--CoA ligase ACSBG2-like isoform X2 [Tubulanus polymorphus]
MDSHMAEKYSKFLLISADTVAPADRMNTTKADEAVQLKISDSGPASVKPITVMTMVANIVQKYPQRVALGVKNSKSDKEWTTYTFSQYYENIIKTAKGFIKLGLEPYHGVGIIGFNSPEWFFSDLGAIFAGGLAVGIYTTNSPEACHYVADNCAANIIVVENNVQLQKILQVKDKLPHLKAIVQYKGELEEKLPFVYSWSELMDLSETVPDSDLEERIVNQNTNNCCTLIYTSGTTGNPKGVMLSHDNLTWTAAVTTERAKLRMGSEVTVSYLPLSHIAAQQLDIHGPFICGTTVYFAQPDALKGSLGETLKEVRPTYFLGVPRVWEKIHEKLMAISKNVTGVKRKIGAWAKGIGLRGNKSALSGGSYPFGWTIANALLFKKVRQGLGFDRCHAFISGAAPITKETLDYFLSINIPIMEVYGMSECTGPHTLNTPNECCVGSCGRVIPGLKTVLADQDSEGNGEICMVGRHVFMGYLNMDEKTSETVDNEGQLHSGDIGRLDEHGFLHITGRIKELIITAGGENIPPVLIEDAVKEKLPVISNCMLIGDKRKFLSILLTLKTEVDEATAYPKDELTRPALDWCKAIGSDLKTVDEARKKEDEKFVSAIQQGIDLVNKAATSRAQTIQKWVILPRDFSIPGDELGPTLKLKRSVVAKIYAETIDALYT